MDWFAEGGWAMYPLLLLGGLGLVASPTGVLLTIASERVRRSAVIGVAVFAVGLALLVVGYGGEHLGLVQLYEAVEHVNPADRDLIIANGHAEAHVCVIFALALAGLPLGVGVSLLAAWGLRASGRSVGRARVGAALLGVGVLVATWGLAAREISVRSGYEAESLIGRSALSRPPRPSPDTPRLKAAADEEAATRLEFGVGSGVLLALLGLGLVISVRAGAAHAEP